MIPFTLNRKTLHAFALAFAATMTPLAVSAQDAPSEGQSAPQAAQQPQGAPQLAPYFKDDIGDWRIRCVQSPIEGEEDVCQLYQLLLDASGNPVSEFTLLPSRDGIENGVLATIVTPLETLLPPGLRISIDGSPEQVIPFTWCNQIGCYARFNMQPADIEVFEAGIEARLSITPLSAPDTRVLLVSSLRGFTLALASVTPQSE